MRKKKAEPIATFINPALDKLINPAIENNEKKTIFTKKFILNKIVKIRNIPTEAPNAVKDPAVDAYLSKPNLVEESTRNSSGPKYT